MGYDELEVPPFAFPAYLGPTPRRNRSVVDARPIDLPIRSLKHLSAAVIDTPGEERDGNGTGAILAVAEKHVAPQLGLIGSID